ncbi:flavin reductase family protein [Sinorhizobium sp. BG8]|nr:flavin reductase family protein [Sinorhizobium sp. BG8]QRM56941.1 flavin reductase family protein [Sinorhizobium sp. BG8]
MYSVRREETDVLDRLMMDPSLYRDAMSRYAGHVQVITAAHEGERRGVTITAACSVSDNPATVLACLNARNPSNSIFEKSGSFALNTLSADQEDVANVFSGREPLTPAERFARFSWGELVTGAPALSDALAVFDCRLIEVKVMATHMILFGEVVAVNFGTQKPPLLYMDRGYRTI